MTSRARTSGRLTPAANTLIIRKRGIFLDYRQNVRTAIACDDNSFAGPNGEKETPLSQLAYFNVLR